MSGMTPKKMGSQFIEGSKFDPPALVLDLSHASLSVIRSLGRRGIKVYGFSIMPEAIGGYSKYCRLLKFEGKQAYDQRLLESLNNFGGRSELPMVIYCLSDEAVEFVSKYRKELSKYYLFQLPEHSIVDKIISKTKLVELLEKIGASFPKSLVLSGENIKKVAPSLRYPVVLKLAKQQSWKFNQDLMREYIKVKLVSNIQELEFWFNRLRRYDEVLVQEFISGEPMTQYYATIYSSGRPKEVIVFIGQKLRVDNNGFGSETFYRSVENREIQDICLNFVERTSYVGFAGLDFKYDEKDCRYKIIEINGRLGLSDGLAIECGLDLPYIYYQHLTGGNYHIPEKYMIDKKWLYFHRDFENFVKNPRGLTFGGWLKSVIDGNKCYLVYDPADIKPFMKDYGDFLYERVIKYFLKRMRRALI
jgi:predicted ATP-grasp superfamily ATP-dependent carboligase